MLFIIVTILLGVSFTSIGAAYIQKSILRKDALKNSPFSLNYIVNDYCKYNNDEVFIDNMLKSNNIRYVKAKLHIVEMSGKENNYFNLINQSEYNKKKTVDLKEKETILVPNYENILPFEKESVGKTMKLYDDKNFVIKDNLKGCIASKGLLLNTFIISDK